MGELDPTGAAVFTAARWSDAHGYPVVSIQGELDISNVAQLRPEFEAVLAHHPERLIIDLSDLSFMDSSGIALLLEFAQRGADVELRNPSALIRRVIEATGLSEILRVEP